jgi:Holliday junction resolvase RusA-like endonuclease
MRFDYIIPFIPPSNNQFIGKNQRFAYQKAKKEWAEIIRLYTLKNKPYKPIKQCRLTLFYHFKDKTRRDPDNYSGKFILDGLVKAGVIFDDSFFNINLILKASVDKGNPRLEILIDSEGYVNDD